MYTVWLSPCRMERFRSLRYISRNLSDFHVLVGPNASGKTNLLEAILVLARGGSYRAADGDLLQFDEPWARLD